MLCYNKQHGSRVDKSAKKAKTHKAIRGNGYKGLLLTIISLFGTMAVKDAITITTTINHDIKNLKKLLNPIRDIKLEVVRREAVREE